ncbi:hypothetical protein BGZ65_012696 [Modicella reniformis]|uniref:Uncharacterized protein n=1 Tax=Modicella reniformis TaxID=1440133 RepID=A0A9P6IQK5_9FUNG|nr:hypothetical protein BGZ65_012696 [Modicella reniformis]
MRSRSRSSFGTSSVVSKYWTAAMAARAEKLVAPDDIYHHLSSTSSVAVATQPKTQDLERGYEEGSIFGDGRAYHLHGSITSSINSSGHDSESRMADILSLRTTGSGAADMIGGSSNSSRHRYRRSTLNSVGDASSFGLPRSTATISTGTLSSIPDSLMISEDEFLERLRAHEMEMQLQQQYYDRYYAETPEDGDEYHSSSQLTISRSNSIPSLTSSNDPFKTFDSNEVLVDMDRDQEDRNMEADDDENPFSDDRSQSLTPPQPSYNPYPPHPHPYHHHRQQHHYT